MSPLLVGRPRQEAERALATLNKAPIIFATLLPSRSSKDATIEQTSFEPGLRRYATRHNTNARRPGATKNRDEG